MIFNKKIPPILIFSFVILIFSPILVNAACEPCPSDRICIPNPLKACSFEDLINDIINFLFMVALGVAPLMIVIGGFYFLTAGEDPARVTTGKKVIIYALIGLLIIFLSKSLIALLRATL